MKFILPMAIGALILCTILTQSTSKYEGVCWNEEKKRWQVEFDFHGKKSKYYFENKFDAIRTRNRVYKKMGITQQDTGISDIANNQKPKTSQYKGVCWHKENKKWFVIFASKGISQKYGGCFDDELDAAKRVNQLCKELGIPEKNPRINGIPNQMWKAKEKTSQYKGLYWLQECKKWYVGFRSKGEMKYGGSFSDELDAAKRVNQLCEELGIPEKNPGIGTMPNRPWQPKKEKKSQYKGVHWNRNRRTWHAAFRSKGGKTEYGGCFSDELDAAKSVNQLCKELGIPEKNPKIGTMPHRPWKKKEKLSQYKGVSWHKKSEKWYVRINLGAKLTYGGAFKDELDAAKRVNQLCEEMSIPEKNPGIGTMPNQQLKATKKTSQHEGVYWHKTNKKWYVWLRAKDGNRKYCGGFSDEVDAAKKVNQLCGELEMPEKNPGIGTSPNLPYKHNVKKIIDSEGANSTMSSEIVKSDDINGTKEKKRKRIKSKFPINQCYFYDKMLKK